MIDLQQKKKGVMQEEMKHLQTEIEDLKEERKIQKMEWAQVSGKLEQDLETCKVVIEKLKKEVENISSERDDFKYEAQRMKESKNRKLKEYDKLKVQVMFNYCCDVIDDHCMLLQVKTATALSVHLDYLFLPHTAALLESVFSHSQIEDWKCHNWTPFWSYFQSYFQPFS